MPKPGTARIVHRLQREDALVSKEEMANRRRVAALLEAEMAKPPTELERSLWEELKADLGEGYNPGLEVSMVTIALTKDIEGPLTEQARKRGMTPEQLALETLRETFAKPDLREGQEEGTLFDFLSGYIGTVEGSGENVSQNGGQLFTDSLVEKKRRGHL